MNVYGVDYNTAMTAGSRLLRHDKSQSAISELKKAKFNPIVMMKEDLIADLTIAARVDVGDAVKINYLYKQIERDNMCY